MIDLALSILDVARTITGVILIAITLNDYNKYKKQPDMIMAIAIILCMQ